MLVSGSMKIQRLNRTLALRNLALQTSGASDGQTLAGASATGTHGAALRLGAFHDTFRALHFVVGPQAAVLVQPTNGPLTAQAAADLTNWLGFPTILRSDDTLFAAAQVHLGSLGILLNAVVETRPLYFWTEVTSAHADDAWRRVLAEQSPASIAGHAPTPNYLQVVLNLTAASSGQQSAWVISMTDAPFANQADVDTRVEAAFTPNPDLLSLLSTLEDTDDLDLTDLPIRMKLTSGLSIATATAFARGVPCPESFSGPAACRAVAAPAWSSWSTAGKRSGRELAAGSARRRVRRRPAVHGRDRHSLRERLERAARAQRATDELLPRAAGIRTGEVPRIYEACGNALARRGVAFGCHWGQYLVEMPERLTTWWGDDRARLWRDARAQLLQDATARLVFASPVLEAAGLG